MALEAAISSAGLCDLWNADLSGRPDSKADDLCRTCTNQCRGPHHAGVATEADTTNPTRGMTIAKSQIQGNHVLPLEEVEARMARLNLTGRLITAEDVAHLIAFLASLKSVAVNGDVVAAGGGVQGAIHY